jgi:hypothetical protein
MPALYCRPHSAPPAFAGWECYGEQLMPQIELGILKDRVAEAWEWTSELEPKLRAAGLSRTFASTQLLALRDPRLGPTVTPVADGYAVFHGVDAMSSFAREVGTSRPISRGELSALEQFYTERGCPVRVWVSDRTHRSLVEMLHGRGYVAHSHSVNWSRPLDSDPAYCQPPNIEVLPGTVQQHENWVRTVAAGFCEDSESVLPATIPVSFFDLFFALASAPDDQVFLARIDDDFVGGAALNVADSIAMLRTASTRYAHRNSGVQQALLIARLKCARRQGARIAVCQTPPSGPAAHNLKKFGFQPFRSGCIMEKRIA